MNKLRDMWGSNAQEIIEQTSEDKPIMQVYSTTDYDKFSFFDENRNINPSHVENLKKSIKTLGLLRAPILVNENFEIIEGQHRFEACKELDIPIEYIKGTGYNTEHIQALNNCVRKWTMDNFLELFCAKGYTEYLKLKKYKENNNLTLTVARCLVSSCNTRTFKRGNFSNANWERSAMIARHYNHVKILCASWKKFYSDTYFVTAFKHALSIPGLDIKRLKANFEANQHKLIRQGDCEIYLAQFESFYNKGKAIHNRIKFFERKL